MSNHKKLFFFNKEGDYLNFKYNESTDRFEGDILFHKSTLPKYIRRKHLRCTVKGNWRRDHSFNAMTGPNFFKIQPSVYNCAHRAMAITTQLQLSVAQQLQMRGIQCQLAVHITLHPHPLLSTGLLATTGTPT